MGGLTIPDLIARLDESYRSSNGLIDDTSTLRFVGCCYQDVPQLLEFCKEAIPILKRLAIIRDAVKAENEFYYSLTIDGLEHMTKIVEKHGLGQAGGANE